jgi:hypothetical protein
VSAKRASISTASIAVAAAALFLGLFTASAVGWYDKRGDDKEATSNRSHNDGGDNEAAHDVVGHHADDADDGDDHGGDDGDENHGGDDGDEDDGGDDDNETPPTVTPPTVTPPTVTPATETTTPQVEPQSPPPASSKTPAAPQHEATPVPRTIPPEGIKGEIGTPRSEGGAKSPVFAQAPATQLAGSESTERLAQTGFPLLPLAIMGGLALAGSSLLFWRSRSA